MDPLTALSVAGNVIQFVDFSFKLLGGAKEMYKSTSGALRTNQELELTTTDLQSVQDKLIAFIASNTGAPAGPVDADAESFLKICDEARNIAAELQKRLGELKVSDITTGHQRLVESLKMAVKSAWTKKELEALQKRLQELKSSLETRFLLSFREKFDLVAIQTSECFDSLSQQNQRIISALAEIRSVSQDRRRDESELSQLTATLAHLLSRLEFHNLAHQIKARDGIPSVDRGTIVPTVELQCVSEEEEQRIRKDVGNSVLNSLEFRSRTTRYGEVTEAYRDTYEWIFAEEMNDENPWANFAEWLSQKDGLYWIGGKAGSGKSTLMKYIYKEGRTLQNLERWADKTELCISSFYFWNSGDSLQKSQQGLFRGLLFGVLNQQPELIPFTFPLAWATTYDHMASAKAGVLDKSWTLSELKDGFMRLVEQTSIPIKLCFLVDGLDEFDGDHEEIVSLFTIIHGRKGVKACISSRPWPIYEDSFQDVPKL